MAEVREEALRASLASEESDCEVETKTQKQVQVPVKTLKNKKTDRGTTKCWRYVNKHECRHCRSTYYIKAKWPALPDQAKCKICGKWFKVTETTSVTMTMRKFKTDLPLTMLF